MGGAVKIAYLMNTYPLISTTFIVREIAALERAGFEIRRVAARRWGGALVDPGDLAEAEITDYLLQDGAARLMLGFLIELVQNPRGMRIALARWGPLWWAGGGVVRHVAYMLEAVALARRLRRDPVAHLHAHFSTNAAAVAMLTHALGGPSYSFTVHGPDEFFDPKGNSLGLKIEHAAFVACISHFCRSQCMIFAPIEAWDRLKIVHCGVRPADFDSAPEANLPAPNPGGRVLFVARLSQLKGGLVLIDAMSELVRHCPGADLVVIGDGEMRPLMEKTARDLGLSEKVHFLGFQDRDTVRAAMADSDVFTLPSFAEGVPVVLMEAAASRRPVVASQVAGVSELVTDGVSGFILPPGDVAALADRLRRLLQDPERRASMGAAGRKTVEAAFDIDAEAAWLGQLIHATTAGTLRKTAPRPEG